MHVALLLLDLMPASLCFHKLDRNGSLNRTGKDVVNIDIVSYPCGSISRYKQENNR